MKERGGVDGEASASLRARGWIVKVTRDFLKCHRCGSLIYPDAAPGCFDARVAIPVWDRKEIAWYAIEVKSSRTALPFACIDDKKREWSAAHTSDYSMWMWVCMGDRINSKKYPRVTYLFPLALFYQLENSSNRKSIAYDDAALLDYKLQWEGSGLWTIPETHQFLTSLA